MFDILHERPPVEARYDPSRILIVEDSINFSECRMLCDYTEGRFGGQADDYSASERGSFVAAADEGTKATLRDICFRLMTRYIEPFYQETVVWWEMPQLLRYAKGGTYAYHADSENRLRNEREKGWRRVHDRDISLILYLNDEFTGGRLHFKQQDIRITPKPGLLVAFPSHHGYQHAAEPTTDGLRYVMVTWAAVKGTVRIKEKPSDTCIFMNELRKDA